MKHIIAIDPKGDYFELIGGENVLVLSMSNKVIEKAIISSLIIRHTYFNVKGIVHLERNLLMLFQTGMTFSVTHKRRCSKAHCANVFEKRLL